MDKAALGQGFLRMPRGSPVITFPPVLHTYSIYWSLLPEGQMGQDWETLKSKAPSAVEGALDGNVLAFFFVFKGLSGNTLAHFRQMSDSNFDWDTE